MRRFLENHSSLYRWAVAPSLVDALRWKEMSRAIDSDLRKARAEHFDELVTLRDTHAAAIESIASEHAALIAQHDAANHRLRSTNRDLVGALRQRGIPAEEHPASKCQSCGSLAAVPEDGRHQMGVVRYADRTAKLYCDGAESEPQ